MLKAAEKHFPNMSWACVWIGGLILVGGVLFTLYAETVPYELELEGGCVRTNPNLFIPDAESDCY